MSGGDVPPIFFFLLGNGLLGCGRSRGGRTGKARLGDPPALRGIGPHTPDRVAGDVREDVTPEVVRVRDRIAPLDTDEYVHLHQNDLIIGEVVVGAFVADIQKPVVGPVFGDLRFAVLERNIGDNAFAPGHRQRRNLPVNERRRVEVLDCCLQRLVGVPGPIGRRILVVDTGVEVSAGIRIGVGVADDVRRRRIGYECIGDGRRAAEVDVRRTVLDLGDVVIAEREHRIPVRDGDLLGDGYVWRLR